MNPLRLLTPLSAVLVSAAASAQAPIYIDLPAGSSATDVTIAGGEVVVVGRNAGQVYRWTLASGPVSLNAASTGGNIRVSADGTRVATTTSIGGFDRASYWDGGPTWTAIPGLGASSGTSESACYDISGDGTTLAGLAWVTPGDAHCFSWTSAGGTLDLGGFFSDPSSRANAVNGNGSVVVGWKDLLSGTRQGARWVNGVMTHLSYVAPSMVSFPLGEAFGTNTDGSIVVGYRVHGGAPSAWRWNASTGAATLLPNLPGETLTPVAVDVTDDGSMIVGHSGGNTFTGTKSIIWINDVPQSFHAWLIAQGTQGVGAYPEIGFVNAISDDGNVIVGQGSGIGTGQPLNGWIVILPGAQHIGTSYCFGDGSVTACPCGNAGAFGNGCASSINGAGAQLEALGSASITADSVLLKGSGLSNSSALYFQGTTQQSGGAGAVFGDGLRCVAGSIVRLKTIQSVAGLSQYPGAGNPAVSVKGMVTTPGVRTYQIWYRNAAAFCTASTFNLTNGLSITWGA